MQAGTLSANRQFESAGNSPRAWQIVAENLLFAARTLSERCGTFDSQSTDAQFSNRAQLGAVELMLKGMAVECLIKALWLGRGNSFVKAGKFFNVPGAGAHDLPQLALAAGLNTSSFEVDLLRRLSHFIEYGGRYPVPRTSNKLKLTDSPRGGKAAATTWRSPSDDLLFESLVARIDQLCPTHDA